MKIPAMIFLCAGMLFFSTTASAYQGRILIITSYHPELAWTAQCEKGIRSVLEPDYEIDTFFLDTKRLPDSEFQKMADMAWEKYKKQNYDLVMIGDDNGLKLLGPEFAKTSTPVVYLGINNNPRNYFDNFRIPENFTGVLERTLVLPWLRHLKTIMPYAVDALILMDKSVTTDAIIQVTFESSQAVYAGGITAEYKIAKDWTEWCDIVKNAGKYDMIVTPTFHAIKNTDGKFVEIEKVIEWTSAQSPVPVFSNQEYTVGPKGFVGSYTIYGEAHGKLAGEIALKILKEKIPPKNIRPQTDREGKFYFNQTQLDRFNLKLSPYVKEHSEFK